MRQDKILLPDGSEPLFTWRANPGPQEKFLACSAYEVLYGGAAGGGKSESLLVDPLRFVGTPSFRALLLRRTFPELERSLIDRSRQLYPGVAPGARYNGQEKIWRFPSGAQIQFGHAEHEHSVHQYQGAEFAYIGFDELTHFLLSQYLFLLSRARSSSGHPVFIRGASNPGGPGHDWVMERWGAWLDSEAQIRALPGQSLYYVNTLDGPQYVERGTPGALSRTFIPATLDDNPHLALNDPGYKNRLMGLDSVTREQLLNGNWMARAAPGAYFKRHYFRIIDVAPVDVIGRVRAWDLAATAPNEAPDPDWTVGVKAAKTKSGLTVIEDVVRVRATPSQVEDLILLTAQIDDYACSVEIPQDPGQAGKAQSHALIKKLSGFSVHSRSVTGDKVTRAKPLSAQAEAGNVVLIKGPWNQKFIEELEAFPEKGVHDDQVDAASDAFAKLNGSNVGKFIAAVNRMSQLGR